MICCCFLQPYHGKQELFSSDHQDVVDINTVIRKCCVMDLSTYLDLPGDPNPDDFYTRFCFDVRTDATSSPELITVIHHDWVAS